MNNHNGETPDPIEVGARKLLNRHGHSFQQAVLKRLDGLARLGQSAYMFVFSEVPVTVHDRHTSIDFILSRTSTWPGSPDQIVIAECKRVDPALGRWLFARSEFTRFDDRSTAAFVSAARFDQIQGRVVEQTVELHGQSQYHIALEMSTDRKGDGVGHGKSAIDAAVAQVFTGTSGLLDLLDHEARNGRQTPLLRQMNAALVLPVVFTTAELLVVDDDLSSADLTTGNIDRVKPKQVPLVWYELNLSRNLRASIPRELRNPDSFHTRSMGALHSRGALIVSAGGSGISAFIERCAEFNAHPL